MTVLDETFALNIQVGDLPVSQVDNADDAVRLLVALRALRQTTSDQFSLVEKLVMELAGDKKFTVPGVGEVEILGRVRRTKWDKPELERAVLDSRLVDAASGEIVDESPLDKIRSVFPWGTPRVTALRERGLAPDEFCQEDFDGWSVRLPS